MQPDKQKTVRTEFSLQGRGLQTGENTVITFKGAGAGTGVVFSRVDKEKKDIKISDIINFATDRRSKIGSGENYVETVEHVMSALWGAEIDNVRIEMNGSEPPGLDGSAMEYYAAIKKSGTIEQNADRVPFIVREPLWVEAGEAFLGIFPADTFKVSYILEYPSPPIGRQFFSSALDEEVFAKEIAPARTFCLKEEAEALLGMGYGKGANYENTLVMDGSGPIDNALRFPDEPVRHKVLDLLGDLYLAGKRIKGRIIAARSGHKLNLELVQKLRSVT